jgi:nucleoside-diphosphate-sugar epimerase
VTSKRPGNRKSVVAIVGCGWYGRPLADLLKSTGFGVKCSKSTAAGAEALRADGIECHLLRLDPRPSTDVDASLFDAGVLVVNIPPSRRPEIESYHLEQMQALGELVAESPISRVLFISATSVYPDTNGTVSEKDDLTPVKPAGKALLLAEKFWRDNPRLQTTVIRFAGLVGEGRDPGRFLAGRRGIANGDAPVNLIHLDDCLGITMEILNQEVWGETFNACCPEHPSRRVFYPAAARKAGLVEPTFADDPTTSFKRVDSSRVVQHLGYRFLHPDPMRFP